MVRTHIIASMFAFVCGTSLLAGCFNAGESAGEDAGAACETGTVCDGDCVDPASSVDHCGSCGNACSVPDGTSHVVARCDEGSCGLRCDEGWADGDDNLENGCEKECSRSNGGTEICDGEDNDCNGMVDEEFDTGDCTVGTGACEATGTYECVSEKKAECSAEPGEGAQETCGDDVDNDCDGDTDEDDGSKTMTWYADEDGDGFGDPNDTEEVCSQPSGYVSKEGDCDDSDGSVYPRKAYPDQDYDGYTTFSSVTKCSGPSPPSGYADSKSSKKDCDDNDDVVHPGAEEKCDGKDTDCDGTTDNIPQNSTKGTEYYIDCDGDSFAPGTSGSVRACTKPSTDPQGCSISSADWTTKPPNGDSKTDCNDDAPKAHPGQTDYFESPTNNAASNDDEDKWDYDCDGNVENKWGLGSCSDCSCSVGYDPGSTFPDCGKDGAFYSRFQACANKFCCCSSCLPPPQCNSCSDSCYDCSNTVQQTQKCQ